MSQFQTLACAQSGAGGHVGVRNSVAGEVKQFCYLSNMLDCREGAKTAIMAKDGLH